MNQLSLKNNQSRFRGSWNLRNTYEFGWVWDIIGWGVGVQDRYPLQMNRLSLRNNLLKMKTSRKLSITDDPVEFEK